jgi:hypothetical protein
MGRGGHTSGDLGSDLNSLNISPVWAGHSGGRKPEQHDVILWSSIPQSTILGPFAALVSMDASFWYLSQRSDPNKELK